MKKFIFMVLFLGITLSSYGQVAGTTIKGQKPNGSFDWIKLDVDGKLITNATSSGGGDTGTWTIILPAIASSAAYTVVLATGTSKLLSEIASFSDGDLIMFQGDGAVRYGFGSKTSAQLRAGLGIYMDAKDTPAQLNLRSGMNMSFVADTALSTFTVIINGQQ